mmetsp:Transcript_39359/g.62376  ORF Transcript_39359/g.62376 Transcript_39359/m.62376 type:complete len:197 (-) Transcript_39359:129-719(-)
MMPLGLGDRWMIFCDASHQRKGNDDHGAGAYIVTRFADAYNVFVSAKDAYECLLAVNATQAEQASRRVVMNWCDPQIVTAIGQDTSSTDMEVRTLVEALRDFLGRNCGSQVEVVTDCQGIAKLFHEDGCASRQFPDKAHFQELAKLAKELDIQWTKVDGHGPMKKKISGNGGTWQVVPFTLVDQVARDTLKRMHWD